MSQKKQEALSSWFQDLAGNKSLQALSRSKVNLTNPRVGVGGWVGVHACVYVCMFLPMWVCAHVCVCVCMLLCSAQL